MLIFFFANKIFNSSTVSVSLTVIEPFRLSISSCISFRQVGFGSSFQIPLVLIHEAVSFLLLAQL